MPTKPPTEKTTATPAVPTKKTEPQPSVLIAEDDVFLLKVFQVKFKKAGFNVISAKDGDETLEKLRTENPDILLLDLVMPQKSGFEVLEELKRNPSAKKIPIIIVSNLGQETDVKHAKELGADEYIIKANYTLQQIVDLVKEKIGLKT
ncbi:response regulator [bacterium]|nr:response regulator [Patescibacteria group bacterium]MBU1034240.1 response regulator [Patescibacteria group bacterium]MBU1958055.1 response regulator [bacterium]